MIDKQATLFHMEQLKLSGMADAYRSSVDQPLHELPSAHELVASLVESERMYRCAQRTQMYLKLSKLRYNAVLEQIECSAQRNLSRQQIIALSDCSFVHRAENILITGATGCGKSYLACAIGNQACSLGIRTLYLGMNRLVEKITLAKLDGSYIKLLNQLEKVPLIILDDFGIAPMDQQTRLTLLQLLEDRYGRKATIIASQLPVAQWHHTINEPTLADAIMDRLTAAAHKFELKGPSKRHKTSK